MRFQITSAGFAAAFNASNQSAGVGPAIKIGKFRIGSAYGYDPLVTDDKLRGAELYSGVPIGYRVVDANTAEFTIRLDETVGTWQFGEISLELVDGTVFALGALQRPQWKAAYPDRDYNRYNVKVRLILNGAIPRIELVVQTLVAGTIWELPSVDDLPLLADAQTNVYLCHSKDENGNDALCTKSDARWTVSTHPRKRLSGTISSVNASGTQFSSPVVGMTDSTQGRYLVQFLNGALKGTVRQVRSLSAGTVVLLKPEMNIRAGDSFELLQSLTAVDGSDDAFFYGLMGR